MVLLSFVEGPQKGRVIAVDGTLFIMGRRDDCDVTVVDQSVSGEHARLEHETGTWTLTDLNSSNGSFLNGIKLGDPVTVDSGDRIKLGNSEFTFKVTSDADEEDVGEDSEETATVARVPERAPAVREQPTQIKVEPRPDDSSATGTFHAPVDADAEEMVQALAEAREAVLGEVGKIIVGQRDVLLQLLTAFFARGHCLLEGVPGLAKTLMIHTLSRTLSLDFHRIQFTPDLMPTDITGTNIISEDPDTGRRAFVFNKGPIFTNVLLADEINRTPPKTQAALLEAMQERNVTSSGNTYALPNPFLVLATQNPLEQEGTYVLPEAQMDRFIFKVLVDYPEYDEEHAILTTTTGVSEQDIRRVLDGDDILRYQNLVREVPVSDFVTDYALRLSRATRPKSSEAPDFIRNWIRFGSGPRAGQALMLAAKAHAALHGRFSVSCEDVRTNALPILRHRMFLNFSAVSEGLDADAVVRKLLETIPEKR